MKNIVLVEIGRVYGLGGIQAGEMCEFLNSGVKGMALNLENEEVNENTDIMQPLEKQRTEVKYIDLFCGLGAFHTAFNRNNILQSKVKYTCVLASDINQEVRNIYEENYGIKPEGDINEIDIDTMPDFDILCAGFPCQPFSIAGNQKGFKDKTRGNLFYKILEIVDKKQPSILMLENVKNLHTIHKGETFKIIKNELEKRGYNVSYKVIDSRYYNSPQSRHRMYIICNKDKNYTFREINRTIVPVSTIIDNTISEFFDFTPKYKLEKCSGKKGMMKYKLFNNKTGKGGRQGERVYDITKCGPTICASSGGPGAKTGLYYFDGKIRTLSINETLKMFGFDNSYKYESLSNKKNMLFYLGNSIVVNVLGELIQDLHLKSKEREIEDIKLKLLSCTNSQTAKNGYKEEELVCKDLNGELIKQAFISMLGNNYDECNRIKGNHKCDIQSDNKILRSQVKKYKKGQFQQLDRHWTCSFIENIPELDGTSQILKDLFEYPLLPNGTHVDKSKNIKKLCNFNYSQEILDNFLDLLNKYKKQILEYAFYGSNLELQPEYLFGVEYENVKRNKIVLFKIKDVIKYLEKLNFRISLRKTRILLGDDGAISLQRKGGDSGKKSSNQLQIKLILSNFIDKVFMLEYKL